MKGIRNLQDVGKCIIGKSGEVWISECEQGFDRTWSLAARRNWIALTNAFRDGLMLNHLDNGTSELAVPKAVRESRAEKWPTSLGSGALARGMVICGHQMDR